MAIMNRKYSTDVSVHIDVEITPKDIIDWIYQCRFEEDLPALKEIEKILKGHIHAIENPDNDDFRSRA